MRVCLRTWCWCDEQVAETAPGELYCVVVENVAVFAFGGELDGPPPLLLSPSPFALAVTHRSAVVLLVGVACRL